MPNFGRFVIGGWEKQIFSDQNFVYSGIVSIVSEHAFVGGQIPLFNGIVRRSRENIGVENCSASNVILVASAKGTFFSAFSSPFQMELVYIQDSFQGF